LGPNWRRGTVAQAPWEGSNTVDDSARNLIQLFLDNVDFTIEEALDWPTQYFFIGTTKQTFSNILRDHQVTYKRLKYVAVQRCPLLRADYQLRVEGFYDNMLVFLDESAEGPEVWLVLTWRACY
jgi:hypothetical protein